MSQALKQEFLDVLCCPACRSSKLLLTKEKILICQACLNGYKLLDNVPDLRLANAIPFKKKISNLKSGINAVVTVLMGDHVNQSFDVKHGHCVIIGRRIAAGDDDMTYVGKVQSPTFAALDAADHRLVEKYLTKKNNQSDVGAGSKPARDLDLSQKYLGDFSRDGDFLLADNSVSRSHAVFYQDDDGVHVLDLISKNGTFVNGREIETIKLRHNDVISLGSVSLRVSCY